METVNKQCDLYNKGKATKKKYLMNKYKTPLTLCGFNSANYDLYFFINLLMKSEYSIRYVSKTIFEGHCLIFFMPIDTVSGKIALKSHDIYQIVLCSLNDACKSYLGKQVKGIFPHKLINNIFFKYKNILNIDLDLKTEHFYKRDHDALKSYELSNYNVKENLIKYAKNDTIITLELYRAINNLCHEILKTDILRMSTAGMMANYGFMLNIHDNVLYKAKNRHKRGEIKTKLYL